MLAHRYGDATPGSVSGTLVLTDRVSAGHSDVEGLVMDAKSLLRDVVQRSRVVCKCTDLQTSASVSTTIVHRGGSQYKNLSLHPYDYEPRHADNAMLTWCISMRQMEKLLQKV